MTWDQAIFLDIAILVAICTCTIGIALVLRSPAGLWSLLLLMGFIVPGECKCNSQVSAHLAITEASEK